MKKITLLLIAFVALTSFSLESKFQDFNFVGRWTGADGAGKVGSMIFSEEGYATMIQGGDTIGGKEFTIEGRKGTMKYLINRETKPMALDLVVEDIESGMKQSMLCAIRIIDKDHIEIAMGTTERPKAFDLDNSIKLKRE